MVALVLSHVWCARAKGAALAVCRAWREAAEQPISWRRAELGVRLQARGEVGEALLWLERRGGLVESLALNIWPPSDPPTSADPPGYAAGGCTTEAVRLLAHVGIHCARVSWLRVWFSREGIRRMSARQRGRVSAALLDALQELGGLRAGGFGSNALGSDDAAQHVVRAAALAGALTSGMCADGCGDAKFFGEGMARCSSAGCPMGVCTDPSCFEIHSGLLYCRACGHAVCKSCVLAGMKPACGGCDAVGAMRCLECGRDPSAADPVEGTIRGVAASDDADTGAEPAVALGP